MLPNNNRFLISSIKRRTAQLMASCPEFEVFTMAERQLLEWIEDVGYRASLFRDEDYLLMSDLQDRLKQGDSECRLWALAYVDLWFCSNFHGVHWQKLIRLNPRNVRHAIQAALYVWWASGSDGVLELAHLLDESNCWNEASEYLEELRSAKKWEWWLGELMRIKERSKQTLA
jgi:hypothetical protein